MVDPPLLRFLQLRLSWQEGSREFHSCAPRYRIGTTESGSRMAMQKKFLVTAEWDGEAGVWVATSDDIPGLVTEAASLDELLKRVLAVAPELLEDNAHLLEDDSFGAQLIDMCIVSTLHVVGQHAH